MEENVNRLNMGLGSAHVRECAMGLAASTAEGVLERGNRTRETFQTEHNDWAAAAGPHRPKWRRGVGTIVSPRSAYLIALR